MEKDKAIKIGLLLVITAGILYWGFNFLSGKNVFTQTNTYYAKYERIDGLQKNASILLRGHKIGQVQDIYFTDNQYKVLMVELSIDKDILIPSNAKARIFSSDLMGTKSIDLILPQSKKDKMVANQILFDGDSISTEIEGSLQDQVRIEMLPVKEQAEKLMETAASAIEKIDLVLNETTGKQLATSFEKIQSTLDALHNSSVTLDTILTKSNHNIQGVLRNVASITQNISNKGEEIEQIIANFEQISDTIAKANIAETILMTDSVMTEFSILLDQINNGNGSFSALVKDEALYNNLEATTKNLNVLIKDIEDNPKKYVHFSLFGGKK